MGKYVLKRIALAILTTFIVYILMNLVFAVFPATRENGKA